MKNLYNLGFIALLFVVLGCSCGKLAEIGQRGNNTPPPPPSLSNSSSNSTTTTAPPTNAPAGDTTLTMDKYNQIKNDMPKADVERILGSGGEEVSSTGGSGFTFATYKWTGENFATIIISYKNDKVMSKSQFGLK